MTGDPYSVLGVSPTASDEEIKAAYRRLAKKYHPDLHPGDEAAAKRMNEINAAYDQIKNPQSQTGGFGSGYADPWGAARQQAYGGARQTRSETERVELRAARNYIRARHFREALTALEGVPYAERNGEWFYLSAVANYNMGNRVAALESARRAVSASPGNEAYRELLNLIESGAQFYRRSGEEYGFPAFDFGSARWCLSLCLINALCNTCCRCGTCSI